MKLGSLQTPWSMATSRQRPSVKRRFIRALGLMRMRGSVSCCGRVRRGCRRSTRDRRRAASRKARSSSAAFCGDQPSSSARIAAVSAIDRGGERAGDRQRRAPQEDVAERARMLVADEVADLGRGVAGIRRAARPCRVAAEGQHPAGVRCRRARPHGRRAPRSRRTRRRGRRSAPPARPRRSGSRRRRRSGAILGAGRRAASRGSPAPDRRPARRRRGRSSTCRRPGRASAACRRSARRNGRARCGR